VSGWLVRGARVLGGPPRDVTVRDGMVTDIGERLDATGFDELDAGGLVLLPGLVDLHTHLREPGREDAETVATGTAAAALGGYTAVFAMANTDPVADTAGVVEQVWRLGRDAGYCDVAPVGAVTVGLGGTQLAELGAMADSAARVRVFSDDGRCVSDAVLMRRALEYVRAFDGVIAQHAEEPRLTEGAQMHEGEVSARLGLVGWPAAAEEAVIARDCLLAGHVGSRLHVCHVSAAGSVDLLRWAKARGIQVTAEVTPHHLLLTDAEVASWDPVYKVNPPLRTAADVAALRAGPMAPWTRSPPTTRRTLWRTRRPSGVPPARGCSGCRPRCRSSPGWACSAGPRSPNGCRRHPRASAGSPARAVRWRQGSRPTSPWSTPTPGGRWNRRTW
jgi:dihydroorotase